MLALTFADVARSMIVEAIAVPVIFVVLLALGRVLKRRHHVRLGVAYKLLCVTLALYLPCTFSPVQFPWREEMLRHLGAASVLLGTLCLLAVIRRFLWEGWFERSQKTRAPKFLSQLIGLLLFIVALLVVIGGIYGYSIQGAIFGSTVVLGIIGFAMQDLLGNIIAGVALEVGKPFRIGDWLIVDGQHAEVIEVNWRSTRLRTNDDVYLDIPNKKIVGEKIINLTFPTRQHALRLQVHFDYTVPPNTVREVIERAAAEVKGVLATPAPKVFLKDFGDSAVIYEIKFWLEDESQFNNIVDGIQTNIWYAAQRSRFRVPFPIRTLHIERPSARRDPTLEVAQRSVRKHPFLRLLDEAQMSKLLEHARRQRFGRGERVIEEGGLGQSMYILLQGEADVFVGQDGAQTHVATLRAGDYCGEMSLLTGEPRSATVVARSDCEMWEIDKSTMGELLQENQPLLQKLGEILAERRVATEGVREKHADQNAVKTRQEEYTQSFLEKLSAFFDL
ncbi:MAG: hypothetical protein QOE70_5240 [Chthoniobacter sp.]|jgi:small-conductance mechanosensitive channel/CRP-like cAMP-binding protein|nr:hypothetical protein [Chthoniobacter sp.]